MISYPIRILHVIGIMNRGGAETMIMNLYRNIDRKIIQFDFVENSNDIAEFDEEILSLGGRIFRCPHYNGKNHFQYKKWWNNFFNSHKDEYQIIHGHLGSTASIYLKIAKRNGLFTIAHSHNTTIGYDLNAMLYRMYTFSTRYIADFFFGCSQAAGVSRYGKNITTNKEKFAVLNNSIESSKFDFNLEIREKIRKEFSIETDLVVGHVGRFHSQKNHSFLIDVFDNIHKKEPNSRLLLLGDGPLKKDITQKVNSLNLQNYVRFMGVQSNINELMQAMDVILFPSLYEGLPVSIVEAQATGLPCVLSSRITSECKITPNVFFMSLDDSLDEWGDMVIDCAKMDRKSTKNAIINSHYDIKESTKWLENFYLLRLKRE